MSSPIETAQYKLRVGCPSAKHRAQAADILKKAASTLHEEQEIHTLDLAYGETPGCPFYRNEVAKFLTQAYQEPVESSRVMLTAGATHGFHLVTTMLFKSGSPVFVVDPTYFLALDVLRDIHMNIIPVPSDDQGLIVEEAERLFIAHRKEAVQEVSKKTPYWAMLYMGSVLANPNNVTLPTERCQRLVDLAKKYNVLLFSDDVYNILYFNGKPPSRLLSYDVSDGGFGNNVISNGTFSKLLSPGIRVGWIETGQKLTDRISAGALLLSGGAVNHYGSQIVATALHHGWIQEQVKRIRQDLKTCMESACAELSDCLPQESTFTKPQGGYFIWIRLAEDIDGEQFMKWVQRTHGVSILYGTWFSPSGGYRNYIRVSITNMEGALLKTGIQTLCKAIEEYRHVDRTTDNLHLDGFRFDPSKEQMP